jgi:hypothetical protein
VAVDQHLDHVGDGAILLQRRRAQGILDRQLDT